MHGKGNHDSAFRQMMLFYAAFTSADAAVGGLRELIKSSNIASCSMGSLAWHHGSIRVRKSRLMDNALTLEKLRSKECVPMETFSDEEGADVRYFYRQQL